MLYCICLVYLGELWVLLISLLPLQSHTVLLVCRNSAGKVACKPLTKSDGFRR